MRLHDDDDDDDDELWPSDESPCIYVAELHNECLWEHSLEKLKQRCTVLRSKHEHKGVVIENETKMFKTVTLMCKFITQLI